MILCGTRDELLAGAIAKAPELTAVLRVARLSAPGPKGSILDYQAAALYLLAQGLSSLGAKARFLEIGTLRGFSAAVLAQAARADSPSVPKAKIITLNPNPLEAAEARRNLRAFPNVSVLIRYSWDHLAMDPGEYDLIFVDGDHNSVARDLPWFNRLSVGGLICFHDYTPLGCPSQSPIVYERLNEVAARLGRFDVKIVDDRGVGMAGFRRREGERL